MNINETDHITKAVITQQEGYITATYLNTDGRKCWLVSSYDWVDINRSLEVAREKFGNIKVESLNLDVRLGRHLSEEIMEHSKKALKEFKDELK